MTFGGDKLDVFITAGIAMLTGVFGWGVAAGTTRGKFKEHDRRLKHVEEEVVSLRQRVIPQLNHVTGQVDILVQNLVVEKK